MVARGLGEHRLVVACGRVAGRVDGGGGVRWWLCSRAGCGRGLWQQRAMLSELATACTRAACAARALHAAVWSR